MDKENKITDLAINIQEIIDKLNYYESLIKLNEISTEELKEYEYLLNQYKGSTYEYYSLITDEKLTNDYENIDSDIREKYDNLKIQNLKLVNYLKYFNPVKEVYGLKTKNGKNKKSYERINSINIKDDPIKKITGKKIARIEMCNCQFTALTDIKFSKSKIYQTIKCKDKFCPICQKIKSTKDALSIQVMYDYVKDITSYEHILITLTAPNVLGEDLKKELEDYSKAFNLFLKYKEIQKINKGYIAKVEVTHNKERDDFHPHYHILMSVPKNYFSSGEWYISHQKWLELWQKAKKDKTITQVNVKKITNKNEKGVSSAILELSKYIAKSEDFLLSLDVFEYFYNETYKKRFFKFGGIYKDSMKKFKAGELEKYKKIDLAEWEFILNYSYRVDEGYEKKSLRKLTEKEKLEIAINEIKNLHIDFEEN